MKQKIAYALYFIREIRHRYFVCYQFILGSAFNELRDRKELLAATLVTTELLNVEVIDVLVITEHFESGIQCKLKLDILPEQKLFYQHVTEDAFLEYPFWYRLFYMFAVFTIFRFRLYFAWIMSEVVCMNAALGAYPTASKPKCGQGPTDLKALENRFASFLWSKIISIFCFLTWRKNSYVL